MSRRNILIGGGAAALLAIAAAGYLALEGTGPQPPMKSGDIDPSNGRRVLYWTDPMIPNFRSDRPGKSPMNMDMVPVYEAAPAGAQSGVPAAPDGIRQGLGVRTAPVTQGVLQPEVQAVGTVLVNERSQVDLQARAPGFVERLFVRAVYDPVRRGQVIATILTPQFASAQEDYLTLRRHPVPGAGDLAAAARERMRLSGMTPGQIATVVRSGRVQRDVAVTAPSGGIVTELLVREGMTVAAGQSLARIASLDPIWVDAEVPQADAAPLRPGAAVRIVSPVPGTPDLPARVLALLPRVSPETRTRSVRLEVANRGRVLVPGMTVAVHFIAPAGPTRLLVPAEALIRTGRRTLVFVDRGRQGFVPVEVVAGREAGDQVEIVTGLAPTDRVAVSGQFLLDSEASLRGLAPQPVAQDGGAGPSAVATGRIEALRPAEVTISHDPVPVFGWPARTDVFALSRPLGGNFRPGMRIRFRVVATRGGFTLVAAAPEPGQ